MTSRKKLPKADRDNYEPLLLVVRASQLASWSECAARAGMTTAQWITDRIDRIAPERS